MYGRCTTCKNTFIDQHSFQDHACVQEAMALPTEELLERLLKSGGCSQEYYDAEMVKIEEMKCATAMAAQPSRVMGSSSSI